jgi:iron(III) transport system ATP-binding protein
LAHIEIKDISFTYENSKEEVLKNFSLNIEKGEIVAVLGESGSGKSTFLRVLSGFEVPKTGSIKVADRNFVDDSCYIPVEKRKIGIVFQDYALFPHLTIEKNIGFGLSNHSKKEQKKIINDMLRLVNMNEHRHKYPHELSGGQQQRVALCRALAPSPSLILLDEPFSNLDANLQHKIRKELKEIIKSSDTTAIFVTHDKDDAVSIADKVVVLENGAIAQVGHPIEVQSSPKTTYIAHLFKEF